MAGFQHILAATDGTDFGHQAVRVAAAIAARSGSALDVVTVAEAPLPTQPLRAAGEPTEWSQLLEDHMRALAESQIQEVGAEHATLHSRKGKAASTLVETAESVGADMLVVGAHHTPALSRFLLGSTTEKVARLSDVPVLIAAQSGAQPYERILAAVDVSEQSQAIIDLAASVAKVDGATVKALNVWEPMDPFVVPQHWVGGVLPVGVVNSREIVEAQRSWAKEQFSDMVAAADEAHDIDIESRQREGHAGDEIVKEADEWGADLVMIGTHGAGFFDRLMMGSRSLYVLRHCERTTLLVPRPKTER